MQSQPVCYLAMLGAPKRRDQTYTIHDKEMTQNIRERKRLWHISPQFHMSILALCLSRDELIRFATRQISVSAGESCDYACCSSLAGVTSVQCILSREIETMLNKKYRLSLTRYEKAECEEDLLKIWQASIEGCAVAGAYWSVMSHSLSTYQLMAKVFSQVEVFALQVLCKNGIARMKTCNLQERLEEKEASIKNLHQQRQMTLCRYCVQISELKDKLLLSEHNVSKLERQVELLKYRNSLLEGVSQSVGDAVGGG